MITLASKFHWEEKDRVDPRTVEHLAAALGVPGAAAQGVPAAAARFLLSRGITTPQAAAEFLSTDGISFRDPFLFENMEKAVAVVLGAVEGGTRILIHGDYDVDGICGTALLYEFLHGATPHVFRFLPDRRKDGYGIAQRGVDWAIEHDVGLFIAVDCGTSDGDHIKRLQEAGMDVVICDHHELPLDRPTSGILLNPVRKGEPYPFRGLCGAGVAFKLVRALEARGLRSKNGSDSLLDLAALATVGDVAPLVDENRLIVQGGLDLMKRAPRAGLGALKKAARLDAPEITARDIGFKLAPRLNAPGRVSNPKPALELLCARGDKESKTLAATLERHNETRKKLTELVKTEVRKKIEDLNVQEQGAFVLAGKEWDEGVLGIAAARVAEDFGKPALLISTAGKIAKGSGRSVPGVHLKEQLDLCASFLERFGGHSQAVGFSIEHDRIDAFRDEFSRHMRGVVAHLPAKPRLAVDADLTIDDCSMELMDFLGACEPFGNGNRNPVWKISKVTVGCKTRWVGKGHLKIFFADDRGSEAEGIYFNWDSRSVTPEALHGRVVDMAVTLEKGYYRDRYHREIHLVDMREHKD